MLVAAALIALAAPAADDAGANAVYTTNLNGGNVFQFGVGAGGLLSPLSPEIVPAEATTNNVAVSPDGTSVYVVNRGTNHVGQYTAGPGGALTPKSPASVAAGPGPVGIAVSPDGASVYVANSGGTTVSQYDVGAGGVLTPKIPATVPTGGHPEAVAVSPDGKSAYVTCAGTDSVFEYDVGAGGTLSPKGSGPVPTAEEPDYIAISPDGSSVYVADYENEHEVSPGVFEAGHVAQYSVGAGGALTPKSPAFVPAGSGASGIAVSPDGASVYVANDTAGESEALSQYSVGPGGVLSPKPPVFVPGGFGPANVIVSPDGRSVYMTDTGSGKSPGTVSQYDVGAGGLLTPKTPAFVEGGLYPLGLAMTPDQGPTASLTAAAAAAGSPSSFSGSASSDPDGTVASYTWSFGDGTTATSTVPTTTHVYAAPGSYLATLRVTDNEGCSQTFLFTGQTAYCNAGARAVSSAAVNVPPAPSVLSPSTPPQLEHLHQSASRWREGSKLAQLSRSRTPVGTTFSFTLNETATVTLSFSRPLPGIKVAGKCVAPKARSRHGKACLRALGAGTLTLHGHSAVNKISFQGRLSRTKKLRPGRYKVTTVASDAAGARSKPLSLTFTIVA